MANVQDTLSKLEAPQSAYLFEIPPNGSTSVATSQWVRSRNLRSALHFQYWPASLQDNYDVEYAEHFIPGGSHPLYQWSGGRGRTISFEAVFTSEVDDLGPTSITNPASLLANAAPSQMTPSALYTVDVAAALAKIRGWMRPAYGDKDRLGESSPPPVLVLVFKNSALNGVNDTVNVILRSAPITIESWFPSGRIRVATVSLTFNEIVQHQGAGTGQGSTVTFIGRKDFEDKAANYKFRGLSDTNIG